MEYKMKTTRFGNYKEDAIIIHGGCFVDGDHRWNHKQALYISDTFKFNVHVIDFNKECLAKSIESIVSFCNGFDQPVGLIGVSSGGFLTLQCLRFLKPSFVWLLAPVMSPKGREAFVSNEIIKKQLCYFKGNVPGNADITDNHITVFLSDTDENIPYETTLDLLKKYPNYKVILLPNTPHKDMCLLTDKLIIVL
jgi:hypothetical protein